MSDVILICDDSKFARKQLKKQLPKEYEWQIVEANDGLEAIELIQKHTLKFMFLDLTMPELDGYGVLEKLQKMELGYSLNTIVISGDIQPEAQKRVKELGALDFLKKPIDDNTLKQCLKDNSLIEG